MPSIQPKRKLLEHELESKIRRDVSGDSALRLFRSCMLPAGCKQTPHLLPHDLPLQLVGLLSERDTRKQGATVEVRCSTRLRQRSVLAVERLIG